MQKWAMQEKEHFNVKESHLETIEEALLKLKKLAHRRLYRNRKFGHDDQRTQKVCLRPPPGPFPTNHICPLFDDPDSDWSDSGGNDSDDSDDSDSADSDSDHSDSGTSDSDDSDSDHSDNGDSDGDIFLTQQQAINILQQESAVGSPTMLERGRRSFDSSPSSKWPTTSPIKYRFHESLDLLKNFYHDGNIKDQKVYLKRFQTSTLFRILLKQSDIGKT
ncbi:hypothetical protein KIN20_035710 [Parelaphostrongylus tenuis]|uniref:Uncharacterized protein n=1 Tax=Parelaphostrongylus tenuis TaxID=148309 RepID=A0AAD5RF01_PARTN|nr:hypothetical protein KIN20_035710 [Parelaphostrongylus tenuis]